MKLRSIQPADTETLLHLWNAACPYDPLTTELLHEKIWGDAEYDPELALVAEQDGKIQALAVGVCRKRDEGVMGFVKLIAASPQSQRLGWGGELLAVIEAKCVAQGAREIRPGESAPNYLTPGVDRRYEAAKRFFVKHDYEAFGETCNMLVDLAEWRQRSPRPSPPNTIDVCRATHIQKPAIRQLIDTNWPSWWAEVAQSLANVPPTLFLSIGGGAVVGFAAYDANNRGAGWFGPMGTAPEYRGQDIGGQLLAACLGDMAKTYPTATIPWVGPVEFYQREAGAEVVRTFVRYRKSLRTRIDA